MDWTSQLSGIGGLSHLQKKCSVKPSPALCYSRELAYKDKIVKEEAWNSVAAQLGTSRYVFLSVFMYDSIYICITTTK